MLKRRHAIPRPTSLVCGCMLPLRKTAYIRLHLQNKLHCLSNRKFGGPFDEIVAVSVHKYSVIMPRPNMMS